MRVVRTLHELGANIETPDAENGVTPLHIAAEVSGWVVYCCDSPMASGDSRRAGTPRRPFPPN